MDEKPLTLTARAAARYVGVEYHTLLGWTRLENDPLPLYRAKGQTKNYRILRKELEEWIGRNFVRVN